MLFDSINEKLTTETLVKRNNAINSLNCFYKGAIAALTFGGFILYSNSIERVNMKRENNEKFNKMESKHNEELNNLKTQHSKEIIDFKLEYMKELDKIDRRNIERINEIRVENSKWWWNR